MRRLGAVRALPRDGDPVLAIGHGRSRGITEVPREALVPCGELGQVPGEHEAGLAVEDFDSTRTGSASLKTRTSVVPRMPGLSGLITGRGRERDMTSNGAGLSVMEMSVTAFSEIVMLSE